MRFKQAFIAFIATIVASLTFAIAPAQAASGHLYNCLKGNGGNSTWTLCQSNDGNPQFNGLQRNQTVCFNGVSYQTKYGPWVLQNGFSSVGCSSGYTVVAGYPYIQYL